MFDDHTCMAFFLSFFSFFLCLTDVNMCIFPFLILSFFVVQILNYVI